MLRGGFVAYFDNAATTYPKPVEVYEYMDSFYRNYGASPGRGTYKLAKTAGNLINETRLLIKELLNCSNKQVIFQPTATIALNLIIQGVINKGIKNVYISPFEHNAVTRTLYNFEKINKIKVERLSVNDDLTYNFEKIRYQFEKIKPDFVIVSHASNVCGLIAPVEKIFSLSKEYDAITLVDMAQTAGLVECNVGLDTFDFAVFAGHKTLYGPTGISGFVMKPEIVLPLILFGGTGFESANQNMPESIPERYEMGTLNISGIAGLNASLKWIKSITIDEISTKEKANREKLVELLEQYWFIKIVGNSNNSHVGIVSCLIEGISSDSASQIFDKFGVAIRAGLQCAPLAHRFLKTYPSGTIRFSVSYFTNNEDFECLKKALDYIDDNI